MGKYPYHSHDAALSARAGLPKIGNGRQTVLEAPSDPPSPFAWRAKGAVMTILATAIDAVASLIEYWKVAVSVAGLVIAVDLIARHF